MSRKTHYLESFHCSGFSCLKNVGLNLSPIHALIGPNDSGKSTVLRAVRTIVQLASSQFSKAAYFEDGLRDFVPFDPGVEADANFLLMMRLGKAVKYSVQQKGRKLIELAEWPGGRKEYPREWTESTKIPMQAVIPPTAVESRDQLEMKGSLFVRLDPEALKRSGPLITQEELNDLFETRRARIASILDLIRDRGDGAFERIVDNVRSLFPSVKYLGFKTTSGSEKVLHVTLMDGTRVAADQLSEGLLVYLAFASLEYLNPVSIILVEEPENGLHPARIAEVIRILRALSETTQVLIATHSPLVVNELEGDEITVVTRDPLEGTRATILSETPNYEERAKVYSNGELWVSYANGEDEAPLLKGEP